MEPRKGLIIILFVLFCGIILLSDTEAVIAGDQQQQPTVSIPTVTGTPSGPMAIVWSDPEPQINVRSGPDIKYSQIGVLQNRQEVPALGVTADGVWVLIGYHGVEGGEGWVYGPLIRLTGQVPIVEKPPTPTPETTATIDPTLASQFIVELPATRLPTFTPPPPLIIPTNPPESVVTRAGRMPVGFFILGLGIIGFFGFVISFLRQR